MARMIPGIIDPGTPLSERRVFSTLQRAPDTDAWIGLHSLGLSNAYSGEYGEIDFVLLIPHFGIVCLEVKGGGISHRDGIWSTRNAMGALAILKRSPFRQAQDSMWKLRRAIEARFGSGSPEARCPIGWMVIFPDALCPPLTPEFDRNEVIDQLDMQNHKLVARIRHAPSIVALSARPGAPRPDQALVARLLSFLRPDFDRVMLAASTTWDAEHRIKALTEEQYEILDAIEDNLICIVRGPAGTGKTMLAIEQARRCASRGMHVIVSCFNRNLAGWLRFSTEGFGPGKVTAGNIHSLLHERISQSSFASDLRVAEGRGSDTLYTHTFFELGALAIEELDERFQSVIVDEVQDIPPSGLAGVVHAWISSQREAKVLLAGDFTRQVLYAGGTCCADDVVKAFDGAPVFKLAINCRNTRRIAIQTGLMSGFVGTRVSARQIDGDPVEIRFFGNQKDCLTELDQIIGCLRHAGFRPTDVAILGTRRLQSSPVAGLRALGGWPLSEVVDPRQVGMRYSTIYAFKGLESPVIIVLGATAASTEETDSLLYVAMSRARILLFLLWPEESRASVEERLARGAAATASGI